MTVDNSRQGILKRFREQIARGEPIIGGGAGTGLSAKSEEAGGIDLLIVYNSGRYRMAGRGQLGRPSRVRQRQSDRQGDGLRGPSGREADAGARRRQRDRPVHHPEALPRGAPRARLRRHPELPHRRALRRRHAPGLRRDRDELPARSGHHPPRARARHADDALRLQSVGGRAHGRRRRRSHRRAHGRDDRRFDWREELEDAGRLRHADPGHRRCGAGREPRRAGHLPRRPDLGAARRGVHHHELPRRRRLLRRELGRAPPGRARDRRPDQDVQEHSQPAFASGASAGKPAKETSDERGRKEGASLRDREDARAWSSRRGASTGGCRNRR